jgi:DNA-binding transcriptional LysR family regulator
MRRIQNRILYYAFMYDHPALQVLCPRLCQFVAVAREEHVTRAALRLRTPQPTLSRAMSRLESELGVPLFDRNGHQIRLTVPGRALLAYAERALAELESGLGQLVDGGPVGGEITLAFLPTLGARIVPVALRGFLAVHPHVRFRLLQGGAAAVLERLRLGEADIGLLSPLPDAPDVATRTIYREELVLTVPAGHPLPALPDVRLAEAAGCDFVGFAEGRGLRRITERLCRGEGFEPRPAFEGEDVETVRGLVAAGLGVALLPPALSPRDDVRELRVAAPRAEREVGLAWTRRVQPPTVAAFRDFLVARAAGHLDGSEGAPEAVAPVFGGSPR